MIGIKGINSFKHSVIILINFDMSIFEFSGAFYYLHRSVVKKFGNRTSINWKKLMRLVDIEYHTVLFKIRDYYYGYRETFIDFVRCINVCIKS